MEPKIPYIRMRDVSRIYDELNIGIIITNGEWDHHMGKPLLQPFSPV